MHPTPRSPLRRFIAAAMATIMATASTIVPAQTIPRQPTADSTHTYRNWGTPSGKAEICNAGFVLSGGVCVALNTGSGATLLPHEVPAPSGVYTNRASYPLLVVASASSSADGCLWYYAYVDGNQVGSTNNGCAQGQAPITFVVPSGSTFSWASTNPSFSGTARVTALANNAQWAQTGIGFEYSTLKGSVISSYTNKNCYVTTWTYEWRHNLDPQRYRTSTVNTYVWNGCNLGFG